MNNKENTLPFASLLRIWQRHLKETAIILARCLPWQGARGALLCRMQQQQQHTNSLRTCQEKGSPSGEWQSLIPPGWCRDQLRVSWRGCATRCDRCHHLRGELGSSQSRISLKATKHPAAQNGRGPWAIPRIPLPRTEPWFLCHRKGPTFQQRWRFLPVSSYLSFPSPLPWNK